MMELEEEINVPEEVASFDPEASADRFRVVALGDSITQYSSMERERRWTGILEASLGEDVMVINSGLGGTSSSLGLFRWRRDVSPVDPHCVVICFLLNDSHIRHYECSSSYLVQCSPDRMEANMRAMFQLAWDSGAKPLVWTPPPVPTWGGEGRRMEIQLNLLDFYVGVLERVCSDLEVPLVDFWRSFPGMVEEYPGPYFNRPDGYHSNEKAQPILARGIAGAVRKHCLR